MTSTLSSALSAARTRCRQLTAANTAITVPGPGMRIIISAQSDRPSPVIIHCSPSPLALFTLHEISVQFNFYLTQFLPQLFLDATSLSLLNHWNKLTFLATQNMLMRSLALVTTPVSALSCVTLCKLCSGLLAPAPVPPGDWRQWLHVPTLSALRHRVSSSPPLGWPHLENTGECVTSRAHIIT